MRPQGGNYLNGRRVYRISCANFLGWEMDKVQEINFFFKKKKEAMDV
jgi:hypothetical protein